MQATVKIPYKPAIKVDGTIEVNQWTCRKIVDVSNGIFIHRY